MSELIAKTSATNNDKAAPAKEPQPPPPDSEKTVINHLLDSDSVLHSPSGRAEAPTLRDVENLHAKPLDSLSNYVLDSKYELITKIGEGGMGQVFRARRLHIGDEVAVKILPRKYISDNNAVERFRREARAAATLHHPNIIAIYDYGEAGPSAPSAYIVMELLVGRSLRALLQSEGRLQTRRAVMLMLGICAGVGAAHRRNIMHRDLKPDNIIVIGPDEDQQQEIPKVLDFGLAKLRESDAVSLTESGFLVGTPQYLSPEQCRGEDLDIRTDVYSLGLILYEMLAGKPPFTAPTVHGLMMKHIAEPPPPLQAEPGTIQPLERIVMRALAKHPEHRQANASVLADELRSSLQASNQNWPHPSSAAYHRVMICPYCTEEVPANSLQHDSCTVMNKPFPKFYIDFHGNQEAAKPIILSVVGFSGHGKTVFLCALFDYLDNQLTYTWPGFYSQALDLESLKMLNEMRKMLGKGILPNATMPSNPRPVIFRLAHMPLIEDTTVLLYDPSGEAFVTEDRICEVAPSVMRSDCVLFLIDLTSLGDAIADKMAELLDTYVLGMRLMGSKKKSQHMIVVYTKSDELKDSVPEFMRYLAKEPRLLEYLSEQCPSTLANPNDHLSRLDYVSDVLEDFTKSELHAMKFAHVAKSWFSSVSYTAVSSLGAAPRFGEKDGHSEMRLICKISPRCVADPLLYALAKSAKFKDM